MRKTILPFNSFKNPDSEHYAMAEELKRDVDKELMTVDDWSIWDRIAPLLAMENRLYPRYLDTLIEYCHVVSNMKRIKLFLREKGDTYTSDTRNGYQIKMRPEVGQLNELRRMLRSYVGDFGLTPSAEKQLIGINRDWIDEQENEFAQMERAVSDARQHTLQ